ncbi:SQS1 [Candida theae]|uniref:SQS1 n=1 Tax=Candida theae TaxID=1198502 RepID=A0AAD5BA12_9ASCO|nr:SQS1 [Candida theae]KAI5948860.1 SQS1 [Candida theae]
MPSKGNKRGRGSSRGGRGSRGSRGGRGGRGGSSRRGRSSNNKSRSGYNNPKYSSSAQHQSLFDPDSLWMPTGEMAQAGHNYGRRSYGKLAQEVEYTAQHHDQTMSRKLRDRPVAFVKAKEKYDPNELLYKLSEKKQEDPFHTVIDEEFKSISLDSGEEEEESEVEVYDEEDFEYTTQVNKLSDENQSATAYPEEKTQEENAETNSSEEEAEEDSEPAQVPSQLVAGDAFGVAEQAEEEMGSSLISSAREENGNTNNSAANQDSVSTKSKLAISSHTQSAEETLATEEREHGRSKHITSVSADDSFDQGRHDYETQVKLQGDELDLEPDAPTHHPTEQSSQDNSKDELEMFIDDPRYTEEQKIVQQSEVAEDAGTPLQTDNELDYGFLPEDFEFDVSKISVTNVRYGINNQYYARCHELTGYDQEFVWIDEDEVIDYALSNGVKEHRLAKFLSYITSGMVDKGKENNDVDDDQVYISSDSEDDDDSNDDDDEFDKDQDDYSYDSDDNLDDLIQYSKSSTQGLVSMLDRDFSNNIPAKKRRNFDNLGIDQDLQDSLTEQIINFRKHKREQINRRNAQKTEDAILSHDLLIKYPDSLTISQIAHEFTTFLQDESRPTLSFPTLDSHGHKTLQSMAAAYNMQTDKCGAHNMRHYIKVTKTRKTYKTVPNFNRINAIMRGRPIFHRMDVKREKKKDSSGGSTKGKRSGGGGGGGNDSRAKFKEGDVVGAEAPALDQSNLGRIMLEKLGWSQGQGLGKGNTGINEPVVAKVKMSKTGLR